MHDPRPTIHDPRSTIPVFQSRRMPYPTAMETNDRIAQWEKMTREAPDDMAWFSLGNAYKDAGRLADADNALGEALKANATMSRAYQLRGQVLMQLGKNDEAAA